MIVGRVIGNVVSTEKHHHYRGHKILVVQPIDHNDKVQGKAVLAIDGMQTGIGDRVLLIDEGGSAKLIIGDMDAVTVRTVVAGIVDTVNVNASMIGGNSEYR